MNTGKFGIRLWCYAAAAFVFGVLDLYLGVLAVAAFAVIAEKDVWLNKQVIQALLLYLMFRLAVVVVNWSIGGLGQLFTLLGLFGAANIIGVIVNIINDIIFVAFVVFAIIAVIRCISGKDGVVFLARLSDKMANIKPAKQTKQKQSNEEADKKQDKKNEDNKKQAETEQDTDGKTQK